MTFNLTVKQVIWYTSVQHSLTSTYISNFFQMEKKLFVDRQTNKDKTKQATETHSNY